MFIEFMAAMMFLGLLLLVSFTLGVISNPIKGIYRLGKKVSDFLMPLDEPVL
jgi:hypothetical protein